MPITQRPKPATKASPAVDVKALINKGGTVGDGGQGRQPGAEEKPASSVVLRVPPQMLRRIDRALADRPLKTPRHTWLLEAVLEKLEREEAAAAGQ